MLLRRALAPQIGRWVFPGGYVDRGEPVDVAAVRETLEEVGLKVSLIGILDVYSYEGEDVVLIAYSADVIGGELKAGDEAQEVAVFPPEDLPWDELAFGPRGRRCATTCDAFTHACAFPEPSDDFRSRRATWPPVGRFGLRF